MRIMSYDTKVRALPVVVSALSALLVSSVVAALPPPSRDLDDDAEVHRQSRFVCWR